MGFSLIKLESHATVVPAGALPAICVGKTSLVAFRDGACLDEDAGALITMLSAHLSMSLSVSHAKGENHSYT